MNNQYAIEKMEKVVLAKGVQVKVSDEVRIVDVHRNENGNIELVGLGSAYYEMINDELELSVCNDNSKPSSETRQTETEREKNMFATELIDTFGEPSEFAKEIEVEVIRYEVIINSHFEGFDVDVFFHYQEDGTNELERDEDLTRHFTSKEDADAYTKAIITYISPFKTVVLIDLTLDKEEKDEATFVPCPSCEWLSSVEKWNERRGDEFTLCPTCDNSIYVSEFNGALGN